MRFTVQAMQSETVGLRTVLVSSSESATDSRRSSWPVLATVIVLTGVAAGIGGMLLALLLHFVQHLAFGYGFGTINTHESFLQGVRASSPLRRVLALSTCGIIAGVGWFAVRRFGSRLVSIRNAVTNGSEMPWLTTAAHDLLQIVTVGLGSPLGREVAPRETGALLAGCLSQIARLTTEERRIMVACGAGAGLAAVYNVPLAGALFALEVLLQTFRISAVVPAITISTIAAYVAWIGLGDQTLYVLPHLSIDRCLIMWSIVAGPVFGLAARRFVLLTESARASAPKNWGLLLWCGIVFPAIGLLAIPFPQILGNGRGLALLGFDGSLTIRVAAILLLLKTVAIVSSLRAGAEGGLLTPGVSIGALLGTFAGAMWNCIWPGGSPGAFAVVGGTAFLASSMKMPLTAIVLMLEVTRVDHDFLIPIVFAVAGSISAFHLSGKWAVSARSDATPILAGNVEHDIVC
jgi:H+/Cl- antiporter ClcA